MKFSKQHIIVLIIIFGICQVIAESTFSNISTYRIKSDFYALANDTMLGRGTGQEGGYKAAKYINDKFAELNLKKFDNSYYQQIPFIKNKPERETEFIIKSNGKYDTLSLYDDYLLSKFSRNSYLPKDVELIFVGFGIIAPEYDYNDYLNIDVSGKVVVFLDGEPNSDDLNYFNGKAPTIHSFPESKFRNAISRGALASIMIPVGKNKPENVNWWWLKKIYGFDEILPAYNASFNLNIILNPKSSSSIFRNSEYDLKDIYRMLSENNLKSFNLNSKMKFRIKTKSFAFKAPNIIGYIEGSDDHLKDSYLIISAHYDHLGYGNPIENDSIYNGAFDNAMGIAVLTEIARVINSKKIKPKRSIIFMALTGEEYGLLGSTYYTDNPLVPLYKTVANINIDGVAVIDEFETIIGIGQEYSNLDEYMEMTANNMGINLNKIPSEFYSSEAFNRSDQIAFANAGIPSILTLDGTEYKNIQTNFGLRVLNDYFNNIYHTPFDDLNQPVNYKAVEQHTKFIINLIRNIGNSKEEPEWNNNAPFLNARLRSKAEKR